MFSNHRFYKADVSHVAEEGAGWEMFKNRSVLFTGASGLIGTMFIDAVMRRNEMQGDNITVYAMGRNREKARKRFGDYFSSPNFVFVEQDLQKPIEFEGTVDYIIHGASNTHPVAYATDPINTILLSILGTENVLKFALEKKVRRVVFLSTVEVYGDNRGDTERFGEGYCGHIDCNTLRAGYPEGKRAAEALCQAHMAKQGIDIVIARICRVFGPTMGGDDSKAIAQFIRNAARGEGVTLKSKGEQCFSYCYVADVCTALLALFEKGKRGEAYNVAASEGMSLREIAEMLSSLAGKKVVYDIPSAVESAGFSTAMKALLDSAKINALGWKAKYALGDALARTVEIVKGKG